MFAKRSAWVALVLGLLLAVTLGACEDNNNQGENEDAAVADCTATGMACVAGEECCTGHCDELYAVCARLPGDCIDAGGPCQVGSECCSFACVDAVCSSGQCVSDNESCDSNGECCSGTCDAGACVPLNPSCRTSGNTCDSDAECCSQYCLDGICDASPSYCTQNGDVCTADFECCGGYCSMDGEASVGTCALVPATGAGGCLSAGEVCGGIYDGGELPTCGGECCSRACLPYGPTSMLICQPPSGCRPSGEVCATDTDCCGSEGTIDGDTTHVTCSKVDDNPLGRCDQGNVCTPAGGICRLQDVSCAASATCCSGNVLQFDTCKLDSLGIPRCLAAEIDCTNPEDYVGLACATAADCCGLPCTLHDAGGEFPVLLCGDACVEPGGGCTTSADCCSGLPCIVPAGSIEGICGEEAGCATYGQGCEIAADCCSGLDCIDGYCSVVVQ